jgi:hydroxypyruvate isomerase
MRNGDAKKCAHGMRWSFIGASALKLYIQTCACVQGVECPLVRSKQKMIKYLRALTKVRKAYQHVFHLPSQDAQKHNRRHGTGLQFLPIRFFLGQEKAAAPAEGPTQRKGNIRQSVSRWCYPKMSLDELCAYAAQIGLKGVDLLEPADFETPKKYGLICTMGYVERGNDSRCPQRSCQSRQDRGRTAENVPLAAKAGVPNVITFSGNRHGMSDEEGAKNVILGLNRVKKIAEDNNVVLCLELLNSKVNHKDYMADHTAWGVAVMKEVNSPHVKLLYDIYHMQIMEGDLIATIQANIQWLATSTPAASRAPRAER